MNTDWTGVANALVWTGLGLFALYLGARLIFTAWFITKSEQSINHNKLKAKRENLFPQKTRGER